MNPNNVLRESVNSYTRNMLFLKYIDSRMRLRMAQFVTSIAIALGPFEISADFKKPRSLVSARDLSIDLRWRPSSHRDPLSSPDARQHDIQGASFGLDPSFHHQHARWGAQSLRRQSSLHSYHEFVAMQVVPLAIVICSEADGTDSRVATFIENIASICTL